MVVNTKNLKGKGVVATFLHGHTPGKVRHAAVLAVAAVLVVASAAAVVTFFKVSSWSSWVAHSLELRVLAGDFTKSVAEAEASEFGYLLTSDASFLDAYYRAAARLQPTVATLQAMTTDNPTQQAVLAKLAPLVSSKRQAMDDTIAKAQQGHRQDAIDTLLSDRKKAARDEMVSLVERFLRNENELLAEREAADRHTRQILLFFILGALVGATALTAAVFDAQRRMTERLRQEASARQTAESILRQSQKMEAIGQLAGGIAHDFNNLLTIILGNLDTLRRRLSAQGMDTVAPLMRPLDDAIQGAKKSAKLTHRLLAFSRQQALEPVPLDLNKLVGGIADLLVRTVGEPVTIETVLAAGLWPTMADANQVENALVNLVVNAKDAMPAGGKITIETANAYLDETYAARFPEVTPGQYVMLSVTDTGSGIPPEILDRVFEPFFTTKEPGTGTGLGLSMIHGFVKQSGGHIRIYSEVGAGTTVKIYLPRLKQSSSVAVFPKASEMEARPVAMAKGSETILVVEDNEGVLDFACATLEDLGYRVLAAKNGAEALRFIADSQPIDLLFTDVILGGDMTGRQLADLAQQARPGLPVLFTTGFSRNAIVHQGRLDDGVSLLGKPYTQAELAHKVRELLDAAAATRRAGAGQELQ